ncbi:MAG: hypothetical protein DRI30_08065, partial [Chloroflexi bacterium]
MMLIVALALVAAACGDDDATDTTAAGTAATTATTAAAVTTEAAPEGVQARADACTLGETDGDLNLYNWTEYIPTGSLATDAEVTDLLAAFEEQTGAK